MFKPLCQIRQRILKFKLYAKRSFSLQVTAPTGTIIKPARIDAIDLTQPIQNEDKILLKQLLTKYHILLFNQQLTKATQIADLANIFNTKLQLHGKDSNELQMCIVHNRSKNLQGSDFWHSDSTYHTIPLYITLLYGMEVPNAPNQGNTEFIDMEYAYNRLTDDKKQFYSTLKGYHNITHNGGVPIQKFESKEVATPDDAIHPLIRVHPISKNKIIYANPAYTHKLVDEKGNDLKNSSEILSDIFDHCISEKYVYSHQWDAGDLLIWDNISVMHRATTLDMDDKYKRVMIRCCGFCNEAPFGINA